MGPDITVSPYQTIFYDLDNLRSQKKVFKTKKMNSFKFNLKLFTQSVWLDPWKSNYALYLTCEPSLIVEKLSPVTIAKALKNSVEIDGFKRCHLFDSVALVKYFSWYLCLNTFHVF